MKWLDGTIDSMDMSLSKLGVGDGQGGLVCCSPWRHEELDTTKQLNWGHLAFTGTISIIIFYYGLYNVMQSFPLILKTSRHLEETIL